MQALLLIVIAITHYGYDVICNLFHGLNGLEPQVFYILRGIEGVALFSIIAKIRKSLAIFCLWGIFEEGQTSVCQALQMIHPVAGKLGYGEGLCDQQTNFPFYMVGVLIMALIVGGMKIGRRL